MNRTPRTPEQKAKARETSLRNWSDPAYRSRVKHGLEQARLKAKRWAAARAAE
jgi:hypothetical protein